MCGILGAEEGIRLQFHTKGGRAWLVGDSCGWFLWSVLGCAPSPHGHSSHLPPQSTLGLGTGHHFGGSCVNVPLSRLLPEPCSSLFDASPLTQSLPFLPEGQGNNRQTNVTSEAGLKVFSQRPQAHFFFLCLQSAKAAIQISNALSRGAAVPFIAHNEFVMWGFFGLKDGLMTGIASFPAWPVLRGQRASLSVCFLDRRLMGSCEHLGTGNSPAGSPAKAISSDL